jgi:hypothetical protein
MSDHLLGPRLKLERAREHIDQLKVIAGDFFQKNWRLAIKDKSETPTALHFPGSRQARPRRLRRYCRRPQNPSTACGPLPLAICPLRRYITPREAALRVRSHISPGPYRSFRELSLAGPVGSDIWCPPTFVGNSGIERFNGICGFALYFGRCTFGRFNHGRSTFQG